MLFNLCLNARDAIGDHGTIGVRIGHSAAPGHCASCSARLEDSRWVWVEVADDGCGMTAEVIERMFEPFFTTKEVGRGTGMGLAMVHGIVHDHGGHIQVQSAPGRGSVFRVLLPAAAEDAWEADAAAAPAPAAARPVPPLQGRVLLVEDESIVSDYMVDLMTGWGLEVVLERDPLAAAQRLSASQEAFDLLLTDQTMPGMTGLALSRLATQHRPGLPVLLYTGNAVEIGEEVWARQWRARPAAQADRRRHAASPAARNAAGELKSAPAYERDTKRRRAEISAIPALQTLERLTGAGGR